MSIDKNDINEIHAEIQMYKERIMNENRWFGWSVAITSVGIFLGIIGGANYETSSWGMLLFLVGVVIGLLGVGSYVSTRNSIREFRTEIAILAAIIKDRNGADWREEIMRRKGNRLWWRLVAGRAAPGRINSGSAAFFDPATSTPKARAR